MYGAGELADACGRVTPADRQVATGMTLNMGRSQRELAQPGGPDREQRGQGAEGVAAQALTILEGRAPAPTRCGKIFPDRWLPIDVEVTADNAQTIYCRIRKHSASPFSARLQSGRRRI